MICARDGANTKKENEIDNISFGFKVLLGVCLAAASVLSWKNQASVFDVLIYACLAIPFLVSAVHNLIRRNKRTKLVTEIDKDEPTD